MVIDSQEHMGYKFERFTNWFLGAIRKRLAVGDYTLHGMEEELAIERKTPPDLVNSIIQDRKDFIEKCERLANFKKKCLVIEGSLSSIKTPYEKTPRLIPTRSSGASLQPRSGGIYQPTFLTTLS